MDNGALFKRKPLVFRRPRLSVNFQISALSRLKHGFDSRRVTITANSAIAGAALQNSVVSP